MHIDTLSKLRQSLHMLANLIIGTLVILLTVVIHTFGLIWVTRGMNWLTDKLRTKGRRSHLLAMNSVVLGVFAVLTVQVWLWTLVYVALGAFSDMDEALYFSTSTFSTLGLGDVVIVPEWRILAALQSVNGFLLIGWSTAYLVAASIRVGPFKQGEHF